MLSNMEKISPPMRLMCMDNRNRRGMKSKYRGIQKFAYKKGFFKTVANIYK
jgi:hypothetical protein